jgi:hypothetical protein
MARAFTRTAQEVADEVRKANPARRVSAKTVCRFADSGWLKHVRTTRGTRLFDETAGLRVLELLAARVPALRKA